MTDTELLELFTSGDELAVEAAKSKYAKYCAAITLNITGDAVLGEECTDSVCSALPQDLPTDERTALSVHVLTRARQFAYSKLPPDFGRIAPLLQQLRTGCPEDFPPAEDRDVACELDAFAASLSADLRAVFVQRWFLCLPMDKLASLQRRSEKSMDEICRQLMVSMRVWFVQHRVGCTPEQAFREMDWLDAAVIAAAPGNKPPQRFMNPRRVIAVAAAAAVIVVAAVILPGTISALRGNIEETSYGKTHTAYTSPAELDAGLLTLTEADEPSLAVAAEETVVTHAEGDAAAWTEIEYTLSGTSDLAESYAFGYTIEADGKSAAERADSALEPLSAEVCGVEVWYTDSVSVVGTKKYYTAESWFDMDGCTYALTLTASNGDRSECYASGHILELLESIFTRSLSG
ncbi:MAG: hypothetical protein LUE97_03590 [Oscillospiraceae bacterium]|nr:hypothetical protein [Oscillospiraceae bacterium]